MMQGQECPLKMERDIKMDMLQNKLSCVLQHHKNENVAMAKFYFYRKHFMQYNTDLNV